MDDNAMKALGAIMDATYTYALGPANVEKKRAARKLLHRYQVILDGLGFVWVQGIGVNVKS